MSDIVGIVIFLAVVIISIARNLQQQKKQSGRAVKPLKREDMPEAYRRQLYGETGPAAETKGPERKSADSTEPKTSTGRQLFEALFGDEDGDWEPVPGPRSELPRAAPSAEQKPPPLPQEPASDPVGPQRPPDRDEPRRQAARGPAPQRQTAPGPAPQRQTASGPAPQRQAVPSSVQQKKAPPRRKSAAPAYVARALERAQHQMHGHGPGRHPGREARLRSSKKLFARKSDVRRAVIMLEILGPPKALE